MSDRDFVDGVALSGVLPAPLIIFSTFVGYFGGLPVGAVAMTIGVFLPAFAFSILFFRHLEDVIHRAALHQFLEGVAAGVVGVIVITTVRLAVVAIPAPASALIALGALVVLYRWRHRLTIPAIVAGAGVIGWLSFS